MSRFDIRDGKNRYLPCSKCGAEFGMGLVRRSGKLAVECTCGHRGPDVGEPVGEAQDKAAFDGWNSVAKRALEVAG